MWWAVVVHVGNGRGQLQETPLTIVGANKGCGSGRGALAMVARTIDDRFDLSDSSGLEGCTWLCIPVMHCWHCMCWDLVLEKHQ